MPFGRIGSRFHLRTMRTVAMEKIPGNGPALRSHEFEGRLAPVATALLWLAAGRRIAQAHAKALKNGDPPVLLTWSPSVARERASERWRKHRLGIAIRFVRRRALELEPAARLVAAVAPEAIDCVVVYGPHYDGQHPVAADAGADAEGRPHVTARYEPCRSREHCRIVSEALLRVPQDALERAIDRDVRRGARGPGRLRQQFSAELLRRPQVEEDQRVPNAGIRGAPPLLVLLGGGDLPVVLREVIVAVHDLGVYLHGLGPAERQAVLGRFTRAPRGALKHMIEISRTLARPARLVVGKLGVSILREYPWSRVAARRALGASLNLTDEQLRALLREKPRGQGNFTRGATPRPRAT